MQSSRALKEEGPAHVPIASLCLVVAFLYVAVAST